MVNRLWWVLVVVGMVAGSAPATAAVPRDDAYSDLVIGVPAEDLGASYVGAVECVGGSAAGLTPDGATWWAQGMSGIGDVGEELDTFGAVLATGDFNGDSLADVVVGVPWEDHPGTGGAFSDGAVHVIYGTRDGSMETEVWRPYSAGLPTLPLLSYAFGSAFATGDFDADGFDELAVAVRRDGGEGGSVVVIAGSAAGLTAVGSQLWHQDIPGVDGTGAGTDRFGAALAAGDFDGDGYDDLAVGVPGKAVGGAVHLFYGSSVGLSASRDDQMDQSDIAGEAESNDDFGAALAAGDFDADGRDDLAIGAPLEDVDLVVDSGMVVVAFGGPVGIDGLRSQVFDQTVYNAEGGADGGDLFGSSLAGADFDGDGHDDLVVGAPHEAVNSAYRAGSIFVVSGADAFADSGAHFNQGTGGMAGAAEAEDSFGYSLAAGDFNGDGFADVAIGVPGEDLGAVADAGCVQIMYGSAVGLGSSGNHILTQDQLGTSPAESGDSWGLVLVAVTSTELYSDGFEGGDLERWSASLP